MTYSGLDIDYLPLVVIGFMYGIVIVTPTNECILDNFLST